MQTSILDFMMPEISIDKPIRLIELFGGYGSQAMALKEIGADFEHYKLVEFDPYAVASYNAVHGTSFPSLDITKIVGKNLEIKDTDRYTYMMSYSFPCFTGDTLVLTNHGFKQIADVTTEDKVLTHQNRYKRVLASRKTGDKKIWKIKGSCVHDIECTENHKFYARKIKRKISFKRNRDNSIELSNPQWVKCKDLSDQYYLGVAINQNNIVPKWKVKPLKTSQQCNIEKLMNHSKFWKLVGRLLHDGWTESDSGISVNYLRERDNELEILLCNCMIESFYETYGEKLCINSEELKYFLQLFTCMIDKKSIPSFMFDMPSDLLRDFILGYTHNAANKICSSNKAFIYSMAQLIAKAYCIPYNINANTKKDGYILSWNPEDVLTWRGDEAMHEYNKDRAFYQSGYIWFPVDMIINTGETQPVYDIEVEDAHSFTANGVIAHNCQDLSLAGKQRGMSKNSGTRSGLLWEVERLLKEVDNLPQILFMENVPQVIGKKNIDDFHQWETFLESLGYTNHIQILNAKNYGVAQNRERCFMFSFLGEYNYHFPEPIPLKTRLKDYLETDVDEKYYIKNEKSKKLIDELIKSKTLKVDDSLNKKSKITKKTKIFNINEFSSALRKAKKQVKKTNFFISRNLCVPIKEVEKWFKKGEQFIIPRPEVWPDLKGCLKITTDKWDELVYQSKLNIGGKQTNKEDRENSVPKDEEVIEPKCLNSKGGRQGKEGLQPSVQDRVYDSDEIATAVTTSFMPSYLVKETTEKIEERKKEQPKGTVIGSIYCDNSETFGTVLMPLAHTLKATKCDVAIVEELNDKDIKNEDVQIEMLGLLDIKGDEQVRRVYGVNGLAPTLNTMQGGNRQPKIFEDQESKEQVSAAIRGRYNKDGSTTQHLEEGSAEYTNAITTVTKDNVIIEKNCNCLIIPEKVGQISIDGSQCGSVYSDEGCFPTLTAGCHGYANPHVYTRYRIRKLTPVECGRLMGVHIDDIIRMIISNHDEANKYLQYMKDNNIIYKGKKEMDELVKVQKLSNSQLYKQYGNSIVVPVMCAMFRNLNIKGVLSWDEYCKEKGLREV